MVRKIPQQFSALAATVWVGAKAGSCGFAAEGFWWRLAACFIASPHPLSNAFFVRDFEGSWRRELVGSADYEASASRRNADAASTASRVREPLAGEFGEAGFEVPIWDEACLVCMTDSFGGERMFGGGLAGIWRAWQHSGSRVAGVSNR